VIYPKLIRHVATRFIKIEYNDLLQQEYFKFSSQTKWLRKH